jgi:hypothetical protein
MSNGASFFSQGYALIVGVGNYRNSSLSVPVTAQDADDLKRLFTAQEYCAYPNHNGIFSITGGQIKQQTTKRQG